MDIISNSTKPQNRPGENAIFPKHTNFANTEVGTFFKNINNHETTPANLFDNDTGMLNLDESVWKKALNKQDSLSNGNDDFKKYLKFEENEQNRTYRYDSNQDGKFETILQYHNNGSIWAMVQDEYNSDINCIQLHPKINSVYIGYDNGDHYCEFANYTGAFEDGEYKPDIEYNNVIVKRQTGKRLYEISFNEDGSAKNTTLRKQER